MARGNATKAIALFENNRRIGEDSAALFAAMAEAYDRENKWNDAAQTYELALKRHRGNIPWRLAWAKALHRAGRHREAEQRYRELLAIDPNSTDAWHGLKALQRKF